MSMSDGSSGRKIWQENWNEKEMIRWTKNRTQNNQHEIVEEEAEVEEKEKEKEEEEEEEEEEEHAIHIPRSILKCSAVSRELLFSSKDLIEDLRIVQEVQLLGQTIEQWSFEFGFVIPNSTNTWGTTIEAAERDRMIPAEILSGNIVISSSFFNRNRLIAKAVNIRVFYD